MLNYKSIYENLTLAEASLYVIYLNKKHILLGYNQYTVEAAYYNRGCYQSVIVIKISGPITIHLKPIKHKPFIIINLSVIVIKLQIIRVHI
jgi:hypothetical protein